MSTPDDQLDDVFEKAGEATVRAKVKTREWGTRERAAVLWLEKQDAKRAAQKAELERRGVTAAEDSAREAKRSADSAERSAEAAERSAGSAKLSMWIALAALVVAAWPLFNLLKRFWP